eukprot:CAMPEP_0184556214 /NCGR_PEP_ID=MMETSP0199_2-20130426/39551_1 /TAXON_ID=1112570 /ORGANISM="Thraustochytrium sp., Strain LLF1b" /LENGTH=78 /DNA_ID=CAMNT_0026952763 /DNA_START=96 /DNA_END=329 /DNA_ORIENTATION=-
MSRCLRANGSSAPSFCFLPPGACDPVLLELLPAVVTDTSPAVRFSELRLPFVFANAAGPRESGRSGKSIAELPFGVDF